MELSCYIILLQHLPMIFCKKQLNKNNFNSKPGAFVFHQIFPNLPNRLRRTRWQGHFGTRMHRGCLPVAGWASEKWTSFLNIQRLHTYITIMISAMILLYIENDGKFILNQHLMNILCHVKSNLPNLCCFTIAKSWILDNKSSQK